MTEPSGSSGTALRPLGRYALHGRLAAGGMATVHFGRVEEPNGRVRIVAVKRLHPQFSKDPEFVAMFSDEARVAARIKHANVVETLNVFNVGDELLLVMEYIRGECFSKLMRAARKLDLRPSAAIISSVAIGMLRGLHAAHEVRDEIGLPLNVVHRDVSPQNIMVGEDGLTRVLDFGVAKASARTQVTRDGQMKGKLSYMSPEQLHGQEVDRRADIFAAGVVLWEALTQRRLFAGDDAGEVLKRILRDEVAPPSQLVPGLGAELDRVVLRALHKDRSKRYQTALEVAQELERALPPASPAEVAAWVRTVAGEILERREAVRREIERLGSIGLQLPTDPLTLQEGEVAERTIPPPLPVSAPSTGVPPRPRPPAYLSNAEDASAITMAAPEVMAFAAPPAPHTHAQAVPAPLSYPPAPVRRGGAAFGIAVAALLGAGAVVVSLNGAGGSRLSTERQQLRADAVSPSNNSQSARPDAVRTVKLDELETVENAQDAPPAALPPIRSISQPRGGVVAPAAAPTPVPPAAPPLPSVVAKVRPAAPTSSPAAAPQASSPPRARGTAKVDCDEPYWVDGRGIRRLKLACL